MKTAATALALILALSACGPTRNGQASADNLSLPSPDASSAATNSIPAASASVGEPTIGRCYLGGCSWFRVVSQQMLREQGSERLVRASIAEGGSETADGQEHPTSPRGVRIDWQEPAETFFLCSAARPMAITGSSDGGGAFEGLRLDFVNGPAVVSEVVSNQYVAVCHPGEEHDERFAARHGYRALKEGEETSLELASPQSVFDR